MKKRNMLAAIMLTTAMLTTSMVPVNCFAADEGKTLVMGATDDFTNQGLNLIFDTLLWRESSYEVSPYVISYEANDDYTEYTLTVTDGITFTDGTPVNAESVKYSIEALSATSNLGFVSAAPAIEVVDEMTIKMTFETSYMNLPIDLSYIYCVKPDSVSEEGSITELVGTGCYVLDEFNGGTNATFSLNDGYWNEAKKPDIQTVEWKVIPDETARIMALENGDVDVLGVSEHANSYSFASLQEMQSIEGTTMMISPDSNPNMYMYNYTNGVMTDLALRKAVTLAVDRQGISDAVTYGFGTGYDTFLADNAQYAQRNGEAFAYDPEEAKAILAEAGYEDTDGNGIVEKDGQDVVLQLYTLSNETYRTVAVLFGEYLKAIGVGCDIYAVEGTEFFEHSQTGDFDVCFTHPWTTVVAYMSWRGGYSDYDNMGTGFGIAPEFADYVTTIQNSVDTDEIQETMDKVWAAVYEFYPAIPLYSGCHAYIFRDDIEGFIWTRGTSNLIDLSEVVINR